ncbi:hypothetical protein A6A04_08470 [Paramagnetospirillum marisnigri]|uniref:Glycosyl transferase family 28 C-terminal domain-containing protein n=1 Tax=Paramagnetospirillum marisnigri TaxID=1285242 RepID=A0A178M589_9PROT|nr:hypothetical protein [Paramagnetospirillum marisnigri]OAN43911.1 hypothetical protein A6A04_08470 [Paramagnetospirillum marisnigri]
MTDPRSPHLWLALSPHGFGHAAMTAPVIAELRRRLPGLRLTIQTAVSPEFLSSRYGTDFTLVPHIPDFGLRMLSATHIDLEASARGYVELHADWPGLVAQEAARLRAAAPDLVLANIPYVTVAAAHAAGIPVVALSSLEWADIYDHYLGHRPEADAIKGQMAEAYNRAAVFLRVTPAMDMPSLRNIRDIGPVGMKGRGDTAALKARLGLGAADRLGLIAFGGIDHDMDLSRWPRLPGWHWLSTLAAPESRDDIRPWRETGWDYADMAASVEVIVTKPGYGTFVEAAMAGVPVIYTARPDWPECPHLDGWLKQHGRAVECRTEDLSGDGLEIQLRKLFSLPIPPLVTANGNCEAADMLVAMLRG